MSTMTVTRVPAAGVANGAATAADGSTPEIGRAHV